MSIYINIFRSFYRHISYRHIYIHKPPCCAATVAQKPHKPLECAFWVSCFYKWQHEPGSVHQNADKEEKKSGIIAYLIFGKEKERWCECK